MRVALIALLAAGCGAVLQPVEPDSPCLEAGYAIAYATEVCTGSVERANRRYDAFEREYRCREWTYDDPALEPFLGDLYDCSFAIRQLPCEVVDDYGDDLAAWMSTSQACDWVAAPAGEGR